MDLNIENARASDAAEVLEYLKQVGSETDNLTFGAEGMLVSVEQEAEFIESYEYTDKCVMYLAKIGGKIVGIASLSTSPRERLCHRGELGISVLKEAWGMGVGNALMLKIIEFAKEAGLELIHLSVRSDNEKAKRLYEKHGFEKIGTFRRFMKVDGEPVDCDLMNLYFDK